MGRRQCATGEKLGTPHQCGTTTVASVGGKEGEKDRKRVEKVIGRILGTESGIMKEGGMVDLLSPTERSRET